MCPGQLCWPWKGLLTRRGAPRGPDPRCPGQCQGHHCPAALRHVCPLNLRSQVGFTRCNSAPFWLGQSSVSWGCPGEGPPGGSDGGNFGVRTGMELVFSFWPFYFVLAQFLQRPRPAIPGNLMTVHRQQARVRQPQPPARFSRSCPPHLALMQGQNTHETT